MNKLLGKAISIVDTRYDSSNPIYGILVLGCFGLLSKYAKQYLPLVEELFESTNIQISSNKSLSELLRENGVSNEFCKQIDGECAKAISFSKDRLVVTKNNEVIHIIGNQGIYCTGEDSNNLLDSFIHEANHLMKGAINCYSEVVGDTSSFLIRSGLYVYGHEMCDGVMYPIDINSAFDEAINTLETADMMAQLKYIDKGQLPSQVLKFFNTLDLDNININGYEELIPVCMPLWGIDDFREIITDNIILGNIGKIEEAFDEVTFDGCFAKYSEALDIIAYSPDKEQCNKTRRFCELVNTMYDKRTSFQKKKI